VIRVEAPGKLYIAGEYAVVEAGEPAVLVAVDRHITLDVEQPAAGSAQARTLSSVVSAGRAPATWTRAGRGIEAAGDVSHYRHLLAAADVVEQLAAERGITQRGCRMRVTSTLEQGGRKLGLGSSAAVTVAAVRALCRLYGIDLNLMETVKAALLATFEVSPAASGGDVAASVFGGWIAYASPDHAILGTWRENTAALLARDWPGLCVRHIPAPAGLRLAVGWTGTPASTTRLVADVRRGTPLTGDFVPRSRRAVCTLIDALQRGDDGTVLDGIRRCRALLAELGRASGVAIETPMLAAFCDAAERAGAAAKPSGAGGGDCGIALLPPKADEARLRHEWQRHGVQPLDLRVWHGTDRRQKDGSHER
jgi:phosphomevalonate kinase